MHIRPFIHNILVWGGLRTCRSGGSEDLSGGSGGPTTFQVGKKESKTPQWGTDYLAGGSGGP